MATHENTRLLVDGARSYDLGFAHGVSGLVTTMSDFGRSLANWNATRQTRKELAKLSDYSLEDIGLCRAEIADLNFDKR